MRQRTFGLQHVLVRGRLASLNQSIKQDKKEKKTRNFGGIGVAFDRIL